MTVTPVGSKGGATGGVLERLDNRATPCALGLLKVQERLATMPLGATLEVVTRDRFAPYEVPAWVERAGLELTALERRGFWVFGSTLFRIKKTAEVRAPSRSSDKLAG